MIKPMKRKFKEINIISYDIETYSNEIGEQIFKLGVVTCENISFVAYDADTLTKMIIYLCEERKRNYIFAHNAEFDFALLKLELFEGFDLKGFSTNPFIVNYRYRDNNNHATHLHFVDSLNFFKHPLDKIGKLFNKEKIILDVVRDRYLEEYCINDSEIVYLAMDFIKQKSKKYDIPFPLTVAQMSFFIYKKHYLKRILYNPDIEEIMQLERESYYGGRVELFNMNKYDEAFIYDINSLYPFVMKNNAYPVKLTDYFSYEICKSLQKEVKQRLLDELKKQNCVIAKVSLDISPTYIGLVPVRLNNKLIFPTGEFTTTLCSPELHLVKNHIKYVEELAIYEKDYIFIDYVNHMYNKRMNEEKDSLLYEFYKIILNSLYGKFGQRFFEFIRLKSYDGILDFGDLDIHTQQNEELINIRYFNKMAFINNISQINKKAFVAIASFVTSYARVYLLSFLQKFQQKIIYCDTDSLILPSKIEVDFNIGKNLGQWKLETKDGLNNFQALGNKHYYADNLLKIKGVPKLAEQIDLYTFKFERITKMKEGIRRFKKPTPRLVTVVKKYKSKYDKRNINKDLSTSPLTLVEAN